MFGLSDRISVTYHGQIVDTVNKESVTADDVLGMIILGKTPDEVTEEDRTAIELRGQWRRSAGAYCAGAARCLECPSE